MARSHGIAHPDDGYNAFLLRYEELATFDGHTGKSESSDYLIDTVVSFLRMHDSRTESKEVTVSDLLSASHAARTLFSINTSDHPFVLTDGHKYLLKRMNEAIAAELERHSEEYDPEFVTQISISCEKVAAFLHVKRANAVVRPAPAKITPPRAVQPAPAIARQSPHPSLSRRANGAFFERALPFEVGLLCLSDVNSPFESIETTLARRYICAVVVGAGKDLYSLFENRNRELGGQDTFRKTCQDVTIEALHELGGYLHVDGHEYRYAYPIAGYVRSASKILRAIEYSNPDSSIPNLFDTPQLQYFRSRDFVEDVVQGFERILTDMHWLDVAWLRDGVRFSQLSGNDDVAIIFAAIHVHSTGLSHVHERDNKGVKHSMKLLVEPGAENISEDLRAIKIRDKTVGELIDRACQYSRLRSPAILSREPTSQSDSGVSADVPVSTDHDAQAR